MNSNSIRTNRRGKMNFSLSHLNLCVGTRSYKTAYYRSICCKNRDKSDTEMENALHRVVYKRKWLFDEHAFRPSLTAAFGNRV